MRKNLLVIIAISSVLLLGLLAGGCKNPDRGVDPSVPDPTGTGGTGDPMDPDIPEPFIGNFGLIYDIGFEGDGDAVFLTENGIQLYTPYGVGKRTLAGGEWIGIATSNHSALDTGRGVTVIGPDSECRPTPFYDDLYVTGGVFHVSYHPAWWAGVADPFFPLDCINFASTSTFESCDHVPHPISYHPVTLFAYQKVWAPDCVGDDTCNWPEGNTVPGGGHAILAYHPDAPWPPEYLVPIFEGRQDFLVYYDYPVYSRIQFLASEVYFVVPACILHNYFIIWDITNPPPFGNWMTDRDGIEARCIADFEFDMLNRLIIAMPCADSVAITEPIPLIFPDPVTLAPEPIIIQQILGGRQNGMGTLPGEFQGPTAVAIDPRNQNILISDTGNGRVQIFDNDGNFIREFGGADSSFTPGAIRMDAFGAIYVANVNPTRTEGDDLRIYNEYGASVIYGTIEGWVYDKDTHVPIDNCRVHVASTFFPLDTFTDPDGHFIFPAVATGTHNIVAEKYGFNSGNVQVSVTGGYKTLVDIYIQRLQITPPGYGQVTGTVITTFWNEPVPGLTAEIVGQPVSSVTNPNGEFTLYAVPEGEHTFRLSEPGVIYYEKYITVTKGGILDLGVLYLPIPIP